MNMNAHAYYQYKKTSIETVAPEKLLIMLYDGILKNINDAKKAINTHDINQAHQQIIKAEDIIMELIATLNMDYEISHSLLALYEYLYNQLVQANMKKDIQCLEEVEGFVMELRDTWLEASRELKASPATAENESPSPAKTINIKG